MALLVPRSHHEACARPLTPTTLCALLLALATAHCGSTAAAPGADGGGSDSTVGAKASGMGRDSAMPVDSGVQGSDSGTPGDTGTPTDTGTPGDTGTPTDTGTPP